MKRMLPVFALLVLFSACKKEDGDGTVKSNEEDRASEKETEVTKPSGQPAPPAALDAKAIGKAAGAEAKEQEDGVVRIGWTRDDVEVKVGGAPLPPAAGLGSWAAFQPVSGGTHVMGDTVVFQDEISPAIDAAFAGGLKVTALHNHFVFDDPPVYFMHIGGRGDPEELAAAVKGMWDAIKAVRAKRPRPASSFPGGPATKGELDAEAISEATGLKAATKPGGVVKVVAGREASMHGASFGATMGLTTWAAFAGSDERASIDGDFAMTAAEVQPVLRALREADIHVVALHNHMIGEEPAYYFVHFWGKGEATKLASGFRAALDAQKSP